MYYAYGIPLYRRFGRINWFHLQNALTVGAHQVPLSMFHRLKFRFLGSRFRRGFAFADVISAESQYSLGLFEVAAAGRKFLSVNGNDDELARLAEGGLPPAQEIATAVGTLSYKALGESFRIFQTLRERRPNLQLQVIGDAKPVPGWLRRRSEVILHGRLEQPAVIDMLRRSRFYIASTYVENSYNGAAEGAFLAQESFISDIPPHHELLQGETCELTRFAGLDRPFFHLHRDALKGTSLKSWHTIITQMIGRARNQNPGTAQIIELPRIAANAPAAPDDRPRRRLPR